MQKRMRIPHGQLAQQKVSVGPSVPGGVRIISALEVMQHKSIFEHLEFAH